MGSSYRSLRGLVPQILCLGKGPSGNNTYLHRVWASFPYANDQNVTTRLFCSYNHQVRSYICKSCIPFTMWGNWDTEKINTMARVTELIVGVDLRLPGSRRQALNLSRDRHRSKKLGGCSPSLEARTSGLWHRIGSTVILEEVWAYSVLIQQMRISRLWELEGRFQMKFRTLS